MASFRVLALLAVAAGANAQPNRPVPGQVGAATGCRGRPGGLTCPSNDDVCFNTEQLVMMGYPGEPWTVDITQCIKDSAVSFITWSEVDANGDCTACDGNQVTEVEPGAIIFQGLEIPAGSCTGTPLCVYVHDGAFERGPGDSRPPAGVPDSCVPVELQIPSQNRPGGPAPPQLCSTCSFIVTPRRMSGACDNGVFCDGPDVCNEASECVPSGTGACSGVDVSTFGVSPACATGVVCDEATMDCVPELQPVGTVCDSGSFCQGFPRCDADGMCGLAADFDPCEGTPFIYDEGCRNFFCFENLGKCYDSFINDGDFCDDGDPCTSGDTCFTGECLGDAVAGCI